MSTLSLGSEIITTESISDYRYGSWRLISDSIQEEVYEDSFPGTSGVLETVSGFRRRMVKFLCTWQTGDDQLLDAKLDQLRTTLLYQTLTWPDEGGSTRSYQYMRLVDVSQSGPRVGGFMGGEDRIIVSKILTFKQVRLTA